MFGGQWFDKSGNPTVNGREGVEALTFYVTILKKYAPPGAATWNFPEILDAFSAGTIAQYIDGSDTAGIPLDPAKSKVIGRVGYRRWPKGPTGKRVTSIWNWSFPINKSIPESDTVF
jgi:multiple sugar transport system substrate-binding protein